MVYPALLATVGDRAHPGWRATSVGVCRTWRDLGDATGALMAGVVAGALELVWAVHAATAVTFAAGLVAWRTMTRDRAAPGPPPWQQGDDGQLIRLVVLAEGA